LTAWEELEDLVKASSASKGRSRDLANNANAAKAKVDAAYSQWVQAHSEDDDAKVKAAKKAHTVAKDELEARLAEAQGAELRARRDELAVTAYQREHWDALLAELEPDATAKTEGLAQTLGAALEHAAALDQISQKVNALVQVGGHDVRGNVPAGHGLEPVVQAIAQALDKGGPVSPMPTWQHLRFLEQQQREAEARARREAA
jgi:hypothetical protein